MPFSVRSGGHGISSPSTNDGGIVIDLSRLDHVTVVNTAAGTVKVGPGARWGDVAAALHPHGLALSSGDSGDVGVGGLATTGGIGLMFRQFGLTIDHLTAATLVTADASVRHVSDSEQPDLFWAVRGAGANFGIVTEFEFTASHVSDVVRASLGYSPTDTAAFLQAWGRTVEDSDRAITAFLYLFPGGRTGAVVAMATVVYAGSDIDAARTALAPFTTLAPVTSADAQLLPYAAVVQRTGGYHTGAVASVTRSGLLTHLDQPAAALLAGMLASGATQSVQVRAVGGAVNDVAAAATAYAHRHQNFSVIAIAAPSLAVRLDEQWEALRPDLDGTYLSFESSKQNQRLEDAFPGPTLRRLRTLKTTWDPTGTFNQNFAIDGA